MSFISTLDGQFAALRARSVELMRVVPSERLYWQPRPAIPGDHLLPLLSCGENILRSAGFVEQTFGGITANMWDDPFEWTLPENLPTPPSVIKYLSEVEEIRRRGFALFKNDADLLKEIFVPAEEAMGKMQTLAELITETLARAAHYQGRAYSVARLFSAQRLPRV